MKKLISVQINIVEEIDNNENSTLIKNLKIYFEKNAKSNEFPDEFKIKFNAFGTQFDLDFEKISVSSLDSHPVSSQDIYVIDEITKQPVKYQDKYKVYHELYRQIGNNYGFATLIKNENPSLNPYRLASSIYIGDQQNPIVFDISPAVILNGRKKRSISGYDSFVNEHVVFKRSLSEHLTYQKIDFEGDFMIPDSE